MLSDFEIRCYLILYLIYSVSFIYLIYIYFEFNTQDVSKLLYDTLIACSALTEKYLVFLNHNDTNIKLTIFFLSVWSFVGAGNFNTKIISFQFLTLYMFVKPFKLEFCLSMLKLAKYNFVIHSAFWNLFREKNCLSHWLTI